MRSESNKRCRETIAEKITLYDLSMVVPIWPSFI